MAGSRLPLFSVYKDNALCAIIAGTNLLQYLLKFQKIYEDAWTELIRKCIVATLPKLVSRKRVVVITCLSRNNTGGRLIHKRESFFSAMFNIYGG